MNEPRMRMNGWGGVLLWALWAATGFAAPRQVLCTTFPLYQITRQVADGRDGVEIALLLPASLGCPHHYALTPADMRKLAAADVLIVNGLGLEEFLGAPVARANPRLKTVDSSVGIQDLIRTEASCPHHGLDGACDHDHHHGEVNPHLFASPRMSGRLALHIAAELSKLDPDGAGLYFPNASAYARRMDALADEMAAAVAALPNRRIAQPHGVFDYLARDIGLEIAAELQPHGLEPSAAEMLALLKTIREQQVGAVFYEPQYPDKVARTLAREAGIPSAELDPGASGPYPAPLDHYETVMRRNLETLVHVLGEKSADHGP